MNKWIRSGVPAALCGGRFWKWFHQVETVPVGSTERPLANLIIICRHASSSGFYSPADTITDKGREKNTKGERERETIGTTVSVSLYCPEINKFE